VVIVEGSRLWISCDRLRLVPLGHSC
jgi:hypothetical protein